MRFWSLLVGFVAGIVFSVAAAMLVLLGPPQMGRGRDLYLLKNPTDLSISLKAAVSAAVEDEFGLVTRTDGSRFIPYIGTNAGAPSYPLCVAPDAIGGVADGRCAIIADARLPDCSNSAGCAAFRAAPEMLADGRIRNLLAATLANPCRVFVRRWGEGDWPRSQYDTPNSAAHEMKDRRVRWGLPPSTMRGLLRCESQPYDTWIVAIDPAEGLIMLKARRAALAKGPSYPV